MAVVILPNEYVFDPAQPRPLAGSQIFVGIKDLDPEIPANQKQVTARQENGTEVPIAQPIITGAGGGPQLNGSPVSLLVDGEYSLKILDSLGQQKFYFANVPGGDALAESDGVRSVDLLANLIALAPGVSTNVTCGGRTIVGDGYPGDFTWLATDQSTNVTADPSQGKFVAPSTDPTGASGAWQRTYSTLDVRVFGAVGDGVTDDAAAIQAALDATGPGESLYFPRGLTFKCNTGLQIDKSITIIAFSATLDFSALSPGIGIDVKSSNVGILGLTVNGPGNSTYVANSIGIRWVGTNNSPAAPTYRTNLTISRCSINGWGDAGVYMRYGRDCYIIDSEITQIGYSAIGSWAMVNFVYARNFINQIAPGTDGNSYFIICSRFMDAAYTEVAEPRCSYGVIAQNIMRDNPLWEGIDSKAGEFMTIVGNHIEGSKLAMTLAASEDGTGSGDRDLAFRNSIVSNNVLTGGNDGVGINLIGAFQAGGSTVNQFAVNNIIENNIVIDYGIHGNQNNGAIKLEGTQNCTVRGNTILNPRYTGVLIGLVNKQVVVSNNLIKNPHDNVNGDTSCINLDEDNNSGVIHSNHCIYESGSGLNNVGRYSIYAKAAATGMNVKVGRNYYSGIDSVHMSFQNMLQVGLDISDADVQTGVTDVNTATGTNQVNIAVSFLREFPILPRVICSTINLQNPGGRVVVPSAVSITTTGFTLVVNSTTETNFASVQVAKIAWRATTMYLN